MQKALLLALIFGAFLFSTPVFSQEANCPTGSTYMLLYGSEPACTIPAEKQPMCELISIQKWPDVHPTTFRTVNPPLPADSINTTCPADTTATQYMDCANNIEYSYSLPDSCSTDPFQVSMTRTVKMSQRYTPRPPQQPHPWQHQNDIYTNTQQAVAQWIETEGYGCPPLNAPDVGFANLYEEGELRLCWKFAGGDNEEEPPCDDIIGDCEEPKEPDCFLAGAGMEVCFADPNDKCDVESVNGEPVYTNCQAGCGFVNDNFVCSDEPELPSLDDCIITTNGYACPSDTPPPDDNIEDPTKPLPDMVKNDFKDVLKGVETRLDGSNKLINDQIARDKDNTNKLAGLITKGNKSLSDIEKNTGSTAKALNESLYGDELQIPTDDPSSILTPLGLTGEEKLEDLEKGVISLSDYRDQFSWSAGASSCPSPRSMNILSKSFTIDWQPYCDAFGVLAYFVKAAALLISGFIAFGVRK